MNIPLTQRQLLAVLKPVWDYLKYWEPEQMGGDAEILGVSKAFFFSSVLRAKSSGFAQHLARLFAPFVSLFSPLIPIG